MRKGGSVAIRRVETGLTSNSPNAQKPEWWCLLDRGKADLKACRTVDAQLSAYLAQQAIEKHAKALILKCGISIKPYQMGHFVVRRVIGELVNDQYDLLCKSFKDRGLPVQQIKPLWAAIDDKLKMVETQPTLKEIFFKDSLGISHDEKEQKIMDECGMNLDMPEDLDISNILDKARHAISAKIRQVRKHRTSFADLDVIKAVARMSILIVSPSIVNLFPHETYGRYPIAMGDKWAAQVYESRREELEKLIADAEKDCKFLEKVALAMPDVTQSDWRTEITADDQLKLATVV